MAVVDLTWHLVAPLRTESDQLNEARSRYVLDRMLQSVIFGSILNGWDA